LDSAKILVLGIGNLLLGDEGVGIHAIRELQKLPPLKNVDILDGGTGGFELILNFTGMDKVIIVDAFKADLPAGTVVQSSIENFRFVLEDKLSVHQHGLQELIFHAKNLNPPPEIILYGIVVKNCQMFSTELTSEVQAGLPSLISMILREINRTGKNTH
jgi:hydrogenase maturation protease